MGQGGGACNKCSDVSLNKNAPTRGLDESSSEGEGEDEEEAEEEDSDGENEQSLEEEKKNAEHVLQEGLRRGKTGAFTEAIEHATALGLDEDKIQLAEKKLEDHKAFRRREAFEAELHEFLRSEDAADKEQCEEKLAQGREYGVGEKVLKPVLDRIAELELMLPLKPDEIELTKQFLEICTRRFVASCIKGRDLHWVDLDSGGKQKSVMKIDLTLKNLTVAGPPGDLACKVSNVVARRGIEAAEVINGKLDDADCDNAVVLELVDGKGPWCFLEATKAKQDEFVCGCQVLNGLVPVGGRKSQKSTTKQADSKQDKAGKKNDAKSKNAKQEKVEEEEEAVEDDAEEDEDAEANNAATIGSIGEDDDMLASASQSSSPKGKKKDKKDKSKKADKPAEKPPPPPPPLEEEEEEEEEASEE